MKTADSYGTVARRISVLSMAGNFLLTAFKLFAGVVGHSSAMISDAVHSSSDMAGSLIVLIGVGLSEKEADEDHPYGHERLECVASILLSFLLALAGYGVASSALKTILNQSGEPVQIPGRIAMAAAVISIIVKELMFHYTHHAAVRVQSVALKAEAWHHRSDALSSVGSLIGIAGARLGIEILDPVAGLLISLFIFKSAFDIFREAIDKMTDHAGSPELESLIRELVNSDPHVKAIDLLHTREFGRKVYVDLEVAMDSELSLKEAHTYAEEIHDRIESGFPEIKHVMIHVNPV